MSKVWHDGCNITGKGAASNKAHFVSYIVSAIIIIIIIINVVAVLTIRQKTWASGGKIPLSLYFGSRKSLKVSFKLWPPYATLLNLRLWGGGVQSLSERFGEEKNLSVAVRESNPTCSVMQQRTLLIHRRIFSAPLCLLRQSLSLL